MSQTVIGIFDSAREAQDAVERLRNSGFNHDNVDVSIRDNNESNTSMDNADDNDSNWGSSISSFFGSLFGGDDDNSARSYSEVAKRGSVLTVHAQSQEEAHRAAEILDMAGAVDIDERAQQYRSDNNTGTGASTGMGFNTGTGYVTDVNTGTGDVTGMNTGTSDVTGMNTGTGDFTDTNTRTADYTSGDNTDTGTTNYNSGDRMNNDTSIPIIEENLQVGKREVESGGARLRSKIIERPVEESVRLRSERVNIERNPVNRSASEADLSNFKEGTIEVTERKEVPIVNKEARVVEEVRLNKEVEEREETIHDTLRSTDVDVERLDTNSDSDNNYRTDNDDDNYRRSNRTDTDL